MTYYGVSTIYPNLNIIIFICQFQYFSIVEEDVEMCSKEDEELQ